MFLESIAQQSQKAAESGGAVNELMKRLDAFWSKAHDICGEFYEDYDRGYAELENEPFECELSSARIRVEEGDKISIDYSAVHIYDACVNSCGPYDEEEDADEVYRNCEERCLEEAEKAAKRVLGEYREVVERWAKKRGVKYTEELKRDELNFTLTIRIILP
jgi:hypothetical protein